MRPLLLLGALLAALPPSAAAAETYDELIAKARAAYEAGMLPGADASADAAGKASCAEAKAFADRAKALDPKRAEGYYYAGAAVICRSMGHGIDVAFLRDKAAREAVIADLEAAAKDGASAREDGAQIPGREYDAWGPDRALGRFYFKLPGMFGGDNAKAQARLRAAYDGAAKGRRSARTALYLAEVLVANGDKPGAEAVLDELLAYEGRASAYNLKRVAETERVLPEARTLRDELAK